MKPAPAAELVAPAEAASMLGVTVATLRNYERTGKLKAIRTPGGQRRYYRTELANIIGGQQLPLDEV